MLFYSPPTYFQVIALDQVTCLGDFCTISANSNIDVSRAKQILQQCRIYSPQSYSFMYMMFNSCSHVFASSFTSGVYCTHPHISLLGSLSNLLHYDLVIAYKANCFTVTLLLLTFFQRGHKLIHSTFSGVCVCMWTQM